LTVNGKAEIVIQDAQAYEEMANLLHSIKQIAEAKRTHDEGNALPAKEGFDQLKERLKEKHPNAGF